MVFGGVELDGVVVVVLKEADTTGSVVCVCRTEGLSVAMRVEDEVVNWFLVFGFF